MCFIFFSLCPFGQIINKKAKAGLKEKWHLTNYVVNAKYVQNSALNWLMCFQSSAIARSLSGGLTSFSPGSCPFGNVCVSVPVCVSVYFTYSYTYPSLVLRL